MGRLETSPLGATVGAEVLNVDQERLLHDTALPDALLEALDERGVLLFRQLGLDDAALVAFGRRLGELVARPGHPIPEVTVITQTPDNHLAEYFRGNVLWHIDGAQDEVPCHAGILAAHVVTPGDAGTAFASTYAAYDELSAEERDRFATLRVVHCLEATMRPVHPNPTADQIADWRSHPAREHPLVWTHASGRKSLVLGAHADHAVGLDVEEGRALLADLLARATRPERVLRHDWTQGDVVIWDNTGVLHRVTDHNPSSPRELHRVTVAGSEVVR